MSEEREPGRERLVPGLRPRVPRLGADRAGQPDFPLLCAAGRGLAPRLLKNLLPQDSEGGPPFFQTCSIGLLLLIASVEKVTAWP